MKKDDPNVIIVGSRVPISVFNKYILGIDKKEGSENMKKQKKNDFICLLLFFIFLLVGYIALCYKAEQIDKQKELPVATQSNSVNF